MRSAASNEMNELKVKERERARGMGWGKGGGGENHRQRKRNIQPTNKLINADNLINSGCSNGDICVAAFFVFI